jgi:hypothetical protein
MAETFEYPPAFVSHRPTNLNQTSPLASMLKLRHHFFLTRLKLALWHAASTHPNHGAGLEHELVFRSFSSELRTND